jgi:hypothetical protein
LSNRTEPKTPLESIKISVDTSSSWEY